MICTITIQKKRMSAANAAAKKRRSVIPSSSALPSSAASASASASTSDSSNRYSAQTAQQQQPPGFSLQQIIAITDNRLINLERGMNEMNRTQVAFVENMKSLEEQMNEVKNMLQSGGDFANLEMEQDVSTGVVMDDAEKNRIIAELETLKNDFVELKSIVLKLQSYTLDVMATTSTRLSTIERQTKTDEAVVAAADETVSEENTNV